MVHISYSSEFLRQLKHLKHLAKKYKSIADDLEVLRDELKQNPYSGADLGGGARKVRMSIRSKGKGKSGGARVITIRSIIFIYPLWYDIFPMAELCYEE